MTQEKIIKKYSLPSDHHSQYSAEVWTILVMTKWKLLPDMAVFDRQEDEVGDWLYDIFIFLLLGDGGGGL